MDNPNDPNNRQLFLDRLSDLSNLTGLKIEGGVVTPHDDLLFATHGYVERDGELQWVNLLSEIENERIERKPPRQGLDRDTADRHNQIDLFNVRDKDR